MAEQRLTIKEWHYPDFIITVNDKTTRQPMDLTAYDAVKFTMIDADNNVVINDDWVIDNAVNWKIKYPFKLWETDTAGTYKSYFSLMKLWVKKLSAPTNFLIIEITEDYID